MTRMTGRRRGGLAAALAGLALAGIAWVAPAVADETAPSPEPGKERPDAVDPDAVRIMFLGDSLTGGPGCWRAAVWVNLVEAGYSIDPVGPFVRDDCGRATTGDGRVWDPDNAGYGGATTYTISNKIALSGLLSDYDPQLIVMLLGTNDVWRNESADTVLSQYSFLLGQMRDQNPQVSLVIGTVPPMSAEACPTCQATLDELNPRIWEWANDNSTSQSPIYVAGLDIEFRSATDTVDGVHPNDSGNAKLAAAWTPTIMWALDDLRMRSPIDTSLGWWIGLAVLVAAATAIGVAGLRGSGRSTGSES